MTSKGLLSYYRMARLPQLGNLSLVYKPQGLSNNSCLLICQLYTYEMSWGLGGIYLFIDLLAYF